MVHTSVRQPSTAAITTPMSRTVGRSRQKLTLDYGVRWEYYTPITERAHRTGSFRTLKGALDYIVNPQPGYSTTRNGWGPRYKSPGRRLRTLARMQVER